MAVLLPNNKYLHDLLRPVKYALHEGPNELTRTALRT